MSKAANMAKISAKGSFHLFWGMAISTLISSAGVMFLALLLGPDQYGLYTIVITVQFLYAIFRDWGVHSAMTHFAAKYQTENKTTEVRNIFVSGLIFEVILGLLFSLLSFMFSDFIANNVFNRPEIAPLIRLSSFMILADGLIHTATAAFTGVEKMIFNSLTLICNSILKTTIIVVLVVMGWGTSGALIGHTSGFLIAGLIGILFMWIIYRNLPKSDTHKLNLMANLKILLTYGVPMSFSVMLIGFQSNFFSFLLPIYYTTSNIMIGNYGIASSLTIIVIFAANPIVTMLFPAFSKLDHKKDKKTLKNIFQYSIKYASLFVVPIATLVMVLSEPIVSTLFGNTYNAAPLFLMLLVIPYIYTAFGKLSVANLINSQGDTKYNLKLSLITVAIGFPLGFILIMNFGVLGLISTTLLAGLPSLFISLRWIKKHYDVTIDVGSSVKIVFSSITTAALTYILVSQLNFLSWIRLSIGIVFFIFVFLIVAILTRTIDQSDIKYLREMFSTIEPLQGLFDSLLNIIEKLIILLKK